VIGNEMLMRSLASSRWSQMASLAACVVVIYSASVIESAIAAYFFNDQLTAALVSKKTKLEVDL
jgi:hypothetical protein